MEREEAEEVPARTPTTWTRQPSAVHIFYGELASLLGLADGETIKHVLDQKGDCKIIVYIESMEDGVETP